MKLTTTLLLVAVTTCAITASPEPQNIGPNFKRNSEKRAVAPASANEPDTALSASSPIIVTADGPDDRGSDPLTYIQPLDSDDPAAFGDEAQRIKRASYVSRSGQQYRIQVVKKPVRNGKVNTIHIYPVNKKTHKKKAVEEYQKPTEGKKESSETTDEQQTPPNNSNSNEYGQEIPISSDLDNYNPQERKNQEIRARRKLEKMLDLNTNRFDTGNHELIGPEGQFDEHKKEKKVKVKHHHHHHHHNHVKTIIKKEPYPVEKIVEKIVHVPKPYPVEKIVEKVVHVPVEKIVHKPYPVEKIVEKIVHVPKPYPVEKIVEKIVEKKVHVPKPYPVEKIVEKIVHVPKPYPVEKIVEKIVHIPVEKVVHVPQPYPVKEIVEKRVPYPVEKIVHVPKPYPVEKIVEKIVHVPQPYPVYKNIHVPVEVKVPVPYPKPVPYPVEKKVPYPVEVKVEVEKKVPYPVKVYVPYEKKKKHEKHDIKQDSKYEKSKEQNDEEEEEHEHSHHFTDSTYHDHGSPSIQRTTVSLAPNFQALYQPKATSAPNHQQHSYGQKMLYKLNPKFATIHQNQQHAINTLNKQVLTQEQYRILPLQTTARPQAKVKALQVEQQQIAQWQQQQDQNRQYQQQLQQYQNQNLQRQQNQIQQQQTQLHQQQQNILQQQQQQQLQQQQPQQQHIPQQQQPQQQQPQQQLQQQKQPAVYHTQQQPHQSQSQYQKVYQQQLAASNLQPLVIAVHDEYEQQTQSWPQQHRQHTNHDASYSASNSHPQVVEAPLQIQQQHLQQQQQPISHQYQSFESDLTGSASNVQMVAILAPPPDQQQFQQQSFDGDLSVAASNNVAVAMIAPPQDDSGFSGTTLRIDVPDQPEQLPQAAALSSQAQSINNFQYSDSQDYAEHAGPLQFSAQDSIDRPQGFGFTATK